MLLGLNFRVSDDGNADFHNYAELFKKASDVLCEYFDEIASIGLKNEFNINATNFLKNLVYYGKPRILSKRIIYIKNYDDIHELVTSFNSNFSKFGITVCEDDLKIECLHEKNKMIYSLKSLINLF